MTDSAVTTTPGTQAAMSRRRLLAMGAITGGGLVATTLAACAPNPRPGGWLDGPTAAPAGNAGASPSAPASAAPSHGASHAPAASGSPSPDHDANAAAVIDRFLGGEAGTLDGTGNQLLQPTMDGDTKVFELTVDPIKHKIDAQGTELDALGFNGMWPGPRIGRASCRERV